MKQAPKTLPVALGLVVGLVLATPAARAQVVVDLDLASAAKLLTNHHLDAALPMLRALANNYKKFSNVRVQTRREKESLATLAQALRSDFDGSGTEYVPDHTIWRVAGDTGSTVLLAASLIDSEAVLLAERLEAMQGMLAFEILLLLRQGHLSVATARNKCRQLGVEMQVMQGEGEKLQISFFGHGSHEETISGKLMVIEPPDLVWD